MAALPLQVNLFTYRSGMVGKPATRYRFALSNLRDPIGQLDMRQKEKDGRSKQVQAWLAADPKTQAVIDTILLLSAFHQEEGTISMGLHDFHGKWISPAVAELAKEKLDASDLPCKVTIHHEVAR